MQKDSERTSIDEFVKEQVEEGELELGRMQDAKENLVELFRAVDAKDLHLVKFLVGEIARKFTR